MVSVLKKVRRYIAVILQKKEMKDVQNLYTIYAAMYKKSINVTALYKIICFTIFMCSFFVHFIYFNQFLIIIPLCLCICCSKCRDK